MAQEIPRDAVEQVMPWTLALVVLASVSAAAEVWPLLAAAVMCFVGCLAIMITDVLERRLIEIEKLMRKKWEN